MNISSNRGFSHTQLLGLVAILALLAMVAVPLFGATIRNIQGISQIDNLQSGLSLARNQAIKRSGSVTICAGTSTACTSNDWASGWVVFYTAPGESTPTLIRAFPATPGFSFSSSGGKRFTFNQEGVATPMSTFVLCDSRGSASARALDLDVSGLVRIATTAGFDVDGITSLNCDTDPNH
ncbi:MAG: GspH/FimT family pseudopilin [Gammaproteobacteria bacterium]